LETITKNKLYEGMFLIDSALAGSDWDGVNNTIKTILEKAGAEIVTMKKWDDRKLAYEIKGKGRGTYILCYFRADGGKIKDIENTVKLSEQIMRVLILNAEKMTAEDMEKDTPAARVEKEARKGPDETERDEDSSEQDNIDNDVEQKDEPDAETEQKDEPDAETEQDEPEQKQEEMLDSGQDSETRD
jgi:small subunit ribosomal protein S6